MVLIKWVTKISKDSLKSKNIMTYIIYKDDDAIKTVSIKYYEDHDKFNIKIKPIINKFIKSVKQC